MMRSTSAGDGDLPRLSFVHFSEYFKINKPQEQLEFVDVPLNTDAPLYVDPYAFKINDDEWSISCNNLLIDFFQCLLTAIRSGDKKTTEALMRPLGEPNEAHLGLSRGRAAGRGMGPKYNVQLVDRLLKSRAFRTGKLRDLSDCELMIPHVSNDRISDIAVNVIQHALMEFTAEQCKVHGVETKRVAGRLGWDPDQQFWVARYGDLPVYAGEPVVLVPKRVVRKKITLDHVEYWRHFCLEFLQQEHMNSNTALVRVLKNGERRGPAKKDLVPELPCDKDVLLAFSDKHPEVLQKYKKEAPTRRPQVSDAELREVLQFGPNQGVSHQTINVIQPGGTIVNNQNTVHGNIVGSVVGGGTINARSISAYRDHLNANLADKALCAALISAREQLELMPISTADKSDAADALGNITSELEKAEPEPTRLRRWLEYLQSVAQPVYHILQSVKAVSDLHNPSGS